MVTASSCAGRRSRCAFSPGARSVAGASQHGQAEYSLTYDPLFVVFVLRLCVVAGSCGEQSPTMSRGLTNVAARNQRGRGDTGAQNRRLPWEMMRATEWRPSWRVGVHADAAAVGVAVAVAEEVQGLGGAVEFGDRAPEWRGARSPPCRTRSSSERIDRRTLTLTPAGAAAAAQRRRRSGSCDAVKAATASAPGRA